MKSNKDHRGGYWRASRWMEQGKSSIRQSAGGKEAKGRSRWSKQQVAGTLELQ